MTRPSEWSMTRQTKASSSSQSQTEGAVHSPSPGSETPSWPLIFVIPTTPHLSHVTNGWCGRASWWWFLFRLMSSGAAPQGAISNVCFSNKCFVETKHQTVCKYFLTTSSYCGWLWSWHRMKLYTMTYHDIYHSITVVFPLTETFISLNNCLWTRNTLVSVASHFRWYICRTCRQWDNLRSTFTTATLRVHPIVAPIFVYLISPRCQRYFSHSNIDGSKH